ncbi:MAG: alpha/beta fold hydrolase [Candidatus Brocadiae bacterium]|nr:alpha/beta fold hydrolase [Candidatus Brocadiia bacterium]
MFFDAKTSKGKIAQEKIILAAAGLFTRKGFANTNVVDICKEADIAIGSFYQYFDNKRDVLEGIIILLKENLYKKFSCLSQKDGMAVQIKKSFVLFFEFVLENLAYYQSLRESEFVHEEIVQNFYEDYRRLLAECFGWKYPLSSSEEISLDFLLGIQMFFAMKCILWEKQGCIEENVIHDLGVLCLEGIFWPQEWNRDLCKPSRKAKQQAEDTREKILKAAECVFGKHGYQRGSVAQICQKVGISVGSFYLHFASKEEVFREATIQLRESMLENSKEFTRNARNRIEAEILSLWAFLDFIRLHPFGYRLVREAEFVDFPLAEEYYHGIWESYVQSIRSSGKPEEYRVSSPETVALSMMGIAHILGLKHILWKKKQKSQDWFDCVVDSLFFGINKPQEKKMDLLEYWKKMAELPQQNMQQSMEFWKNIFSMNPQNLAGFWETWKKMLENMQTMSPNIVQGWSKHISEDYQKTLNQKTFGAFQEWDKKILGQLQNMAANNFMQSYQKLMKDSTEFVQDMQKRDPQIFMEYWQGMLTEYFRDMELVGKDAQKIDLKHLMEVCMKASTGQWDESVKKYMERFWDAWKIKAQYGPEYYAKPEDVKVGQTPKETVWQKGTWKLYHYKAVPEASKNMPIFIVYALINKYYIEDLTPSCSLVQYLIKQGYDVYLTDWGNPTYEDRHITLDKLIEEGIGGMVDFIREKHKVEKVPILGHCMGGVLSTIYTALHQDKVSSLVTLTAPMTARKGGVVSAWSYLSPIDTVIDTFGNVPAKLIRYTFISMKPYYEIMRWQRYYTSLDQMNEKAIEFSNAVDKWVNDNVDIPGEFFRKFFKEVFVKDSLVHGTMEINGKKVQLSNIHCPVMNIYGEEDWIVTPDSASVLYDLVSSKEKKNKPIFGQHLGFLFDPRNRVVWDEMSSFFFGGQNATTKA